MSNKIIKNNSGISIVEVIVAILIITMGMVGVLSLVIQNIQAQYINKNILIASGLAQEGLELVRNVRDLNWLTPGNDWNKYIASGVVNATITYTIDYSGSINPLVGSLDDNGARLYTNGVSGNGFYTHTETVTPTNFYRLMTVINHTDYLDVKCTIRWQEGTENHDYTAETYLYNWR